ncbi:hypothetical protein K504DRAFT_389678 [Pleomassaria siparia CBS 279.74]|uniref:DUF7053 domain-containing protein n=1 Tax=Pleomassaria siparia CBS 279.74 TaxID=1314801 RepID=A0A6G1JWN5_9PLEO|nr:hypothetical protein K504DRAFT_389678 [Pleomassaria siparia CBS 279.74]
MTAAKHNLHVAALIPGHLTPDDIISALHDHSTILTLPTANISHTHIATTDPSVESTIQKDTYWYPADLHPISTYSVTQAVTMIPGIGPRGTKHVTFPASIQSTPLGIKTLSDASGVILRAEFRVIAGGADDGEVEGEGEGIGFADWVLVEDVEVQTSWYMMPFVRGATEDTHKDICRKVIEKVEMEKRQEAIARTAAKGKGRQSLTGSLKSDGSAYKGIARQLTDGDGEAIGKPEKTTYG